MGTPITKETTRLTPFPPPSFNQKQKFPCNSYRPCTAIHGWRAGDGSGGRRVRFPPRPASAAPPPPRLAAPARSGMVPVRHAQVAPPPVARNTVATGWPARLTHSPGSRQAPTEVVQSGDAAGPPRSSQTKIAFLIAGMRRWARRSTSRARVYQTPAAERRCLANNV